jgi:hypothetical protein
MSYPYPQPQPQPPRQGMSTGAKIAAFGCGGLAIASLLFVGGCVVIGGAVVNEVDKQVKAEEQADVRAAKEDVKITTCKVVDSVIGWDIKAEVKITNNGDKRADYYIDGEFLDQDGNKVTELMASVQNLAPGTSSTQNFSGFVTSDQMDGVTKGSCKILDVSRDEWSAVN